MNKKALLVASLLSIATVNAEDVIQTPAPVTTETAPVATETASAVTQTAPTTQTLAPAAADKGYFGPAWEAINSNRVMTTALVAIAFFFGAVAHAAASTDNVEEDVE